MYVGSGNRFAIEGILFNSGQELPAKFIDKVKTSGRLEVYLKKGAISKDSPKLDAVVDKKSGSANVKKIASVPKREPTSVPNAKK